MPIEEKFQVYYFQFISSYIENISYPACCRLSVLQHSPVTTTDKKLKLSFPAD
ncbi:hypothetical protein MmTuc01_0238 [Methanosarcina mazei Tuc01]|uniref:Uncharacterized protein n=1 Tax=Methanosarcina mazei Tuc01 TaxID=1236903 RepID=M1P5M5_METMZ|nr:hypothetical protein MmTuc01_0238 [Methanosarcina mazei Tuc01]